MMGVSTATAGALCVLLLDRRRRARAQAVREFWRRCESGPKPNWKQGVPHRAALIGTPNPPCGCTTRAADAVAVQGRVRWRDDDTAGDEPAGHRVIVSGGLRYVRPRCRWELHRIVIPPQNHHSEEAAKGCSRPTVALCDALARQYPCGVPRRFRGCQRDFWAAAIRAGMQYVPRHDVRASLPGRRHLLLPSSPPSRCGKAGGRGVRARW